MNKPELREMRINSILGRPLPQDALTELIEHAEAAFDTAEAADTEELASKIEELRERLEEMAKDRDEWREEAQRRHDVIQEMRAKAAKGERAEDLAAEVEQLRKRLHEVESERDRLANEGTTLTVSRLTGFLVDQAEANRREAAGMRSELDMYRAVNLNGAPVHYRDGLVLVQLPRVLWRNPRVEDGSPPCRCGICPGDGSWDTLAIAVRPKRGEKTGTAWTVHHPEGRR